MICIMIRKDEASPGARTMGDIFGGTSTLDTFHYMPPKILLFSE